MPVFKHKSTTSKATQTLNFKDYKNLSLLKQQFYTKIKPPSLHYDYRLAEKNHLKEDRENKSFAIKVWAILFQAKIPLKT